MKIGLVGCASMHANGFLKVLNHPTSETNRITAIWGEPGEEKRLRSLAKTYNIKTVVEDYNEMVSMVDAALIITRNGAGHLSQATPFLSSGIPVCVDKPLSLTLNDANMMCDLAEKNNTVLVGGSGVKHCSAARELKDTIHNLKQMDALHVSACTSVGHMMGGAAFYGSHLTDLANFWFGDDIENVYTYQVGSTLNVILEYRDGRVFSMLMARDIVDFMYNLCARGASASGTIDLSDYFINWSQYFINVAEKSIAAPARAELLAPVKIMTDIQLSIDKARGRVF